MNEARSIRRGDIYYYDFGENKGSIQSGNRPVLVVQADNFNQNAPTVIVAAITTVIKKQYMASHIILPDDTGLGRPSMVMLEQIRAVNKEDLQDYVGSLQDGPTWKRVNNGIKKGETVAYAYTISGVSASDEVEVDIIGVSAGWEAEVVADDNTSGVVKVTNNADGEAKVTV